MHVYFGATFKARVTLGTHGKMVVSGPGKRAVSGILEHYRPYVKDDAELFGRLPRLLRGYWHVDETGV